MAASILSSVPSGVDTVRDIIVFVVRGTEAAAGRRHMTRRSRGADRGPYLGWGLRYLRISRSKIEDTSEERRTMREWQFVSRNRARGENTARVSVPISNLRARRASSGPTGRCRIWTVCCLFFWLCRLAGGRAGNASGSSVRIPCRIQHHRGWTAWTGKWIIGWQKTTCDGLISLPRASGRAGFYAGKARIRHDECSGNGNKQNCKTLIGR